MRTAAWDRSKGRQSLSWPFYVRHVATAEITSAFGQKAYRANAAVIQNYAWHFRVAGLKPYGDPPVYAHIENSTWDQCFKPHKKVPTKWAGDLYDVLDERIAESDGDLTYTEYRAGTENCVESRWPENGDTLSQLGSKQRAESNTTACGGDETWRDIVQYYYTATVGSGQPPAAPDTNYSRPPDQIRFAFSSTGGWRFQVEEELRGDDGVYRWFTIHDRGWSSKAREIINAFTYRPPQEDPPCHKYRVRVRNPVGWSGYTKRLIHNRP